MAFYAQPEQNAQVGPGEMYRSGVESGPEPSGQAGSGPEVRLPEDPWTLTRATSSRLHRHQAAKRRQA